MLNMKVAVVVDEYFSRTLDIVNNMNIHGGRMEKIMAVEEILRSMTSTFDYVVWSIEESMTVEELQSSLLVHEQRMKGNKEEESALKLSNAERT